MMKKYVKVAEIREFLRNKMKLFNIEGHEIIVVNAEGMFYAFENRCPHMGYPLYLGSLEGNIITCGFHYAKFDITTGRALGPPSNKPLKTFKVKVQNSTIFIEL